MDISNVTLHEIWFRETLRQVYDVVRNRTMLLAQHQILGFQHILKNKILNRYQDDKSLSFPFEYYLVLKPVSYKKQ